MRYVLPSIRPIDVYKRQIYKKLDDAIKAVGAAEGVIYIFDLARTSIPYVNEAQSINLTNKVQANLGIK